MRPTPRDIRLLENFKRTRAVLNRHWRTEFCSDRALLQWRTRVLRGDLLYGWDYGGVHVYQPTLRGCQLAKLPRNYARQLGMAEAAPRWLAISSYWKLRPNGSPPYTFEEVRERFPAALNLSTIQYFPLAPDAWNGAELVSQLHYTTTSSCERLHRKLSGWIADYEENGDDDTPGLAHLINEGRFGFVILIQPLATDHRREVRAMRDHFRNHPLPRSVYVRVWCDPDLPKIVERPNGTHS